MKIEIGSLVVEVDGEGLLIRAGDFHSVQLTERDGPTVRVARSDADKFLRAVDLAVQEVRDG